MDKGGGGLGIRTGGGRGWEGGAAGSYDRDRGRSCSQSSSGSSSTVWHSQSDDDDNDDDGEMGDGGADASSTGSGKVVPVRGDTSTGPVVSSSDNPAERYATVDLKRAADTMRRARTVPMNANANGDGATAMPQQAQEESSGQPQPIGSSGSSNANTKSPRPVLLTRRTPTTLPTTKNTKASIEDGQAQRGPRHAATMPPPERPHYDGADGDGHGKEKKKGVSFLSRFIPGAGSSSKKQTNHATSSSHDALESLAERDDDDADGSNDSSQRPEGMDAQLFSHGVDDDVEGIAYQPKYPQPPLYIKFRSKFKKEREFDRVFLAQELQAGRPKPPRRRTASSLNSPALQVTPLESDENAVWALEFSKDGKYLAAAGQDRIVRVWAVLSTPEERQLHEQEEDEDETSIRQQRHLEAPVFRKKPIREYEGHEGAIIDLSWSKNNFLLSASADKTVRLWHISRAECLCTFKHTEHVHSVQFHPRDDRFFLAGSRDMKLRFWSIPDKSVAFWQQLNEIITAVAFTPDGKTAIAGTVNGVCNFYETEGLKYQTQIQVRSAYGKNAKPSKICSIDTINMSERERADVKLLISTNDSRIRLYNFRDKSLETKFKGHKSEERTIKALFSDNGQYIIAGSEDKAAYIWSMGPSESDKPSQRPVEFFEATTSQTTCAALAPTKARQLLSQSEDPIFDLCNPPPITLVSRSESAASSRAPSQANSTANTPRTTESPRKKAIESPAYVARTAHVAGNIIVTASNTGVIRVYRQDCAATKRKTAEDASSIFGGAGKRPSSVYMARAMSRSSATGQRNPSRSESLNTQPPNDRIMTWRQGISSTHSLDRKQSDAKSTRSMSPSKSGYSFRRSGSIRRALGKDGGKASVEAMTPTTASSSTPGVRIERASTPSLPLRQSESSGNSPPSVKNGTSSAPLSKQTSHTTAEAESAEGKRSNDTHLHPSSDDTPTPLASPSPEVNPLWLQNGQSFLGWNMKEYASLALKKLTPASTSSHPYPTTTTTTNNGLLRPELATQNSTLTVVSKLSSEGSRTPESAELSGDEEGAKRLRKLETLRCRKCGRGSFKARATKKGEQVLECQRCGTVAGSGPS